MSEGKNIEILEKPEQDKIVFGPGHAQKLIEVGLIPKGSLHYSTKYSAYPVAVGIDELLKNPDLIEDKEVQVTFGIHKLNQGVKSILFSIIYFELGQHHISFDLMSAFENPKSSKSFVENILNDQEEFEGKIENEYWIARNANYLLAKLSGKGEEAERLRDRVDMIIKDEDGEIIGLEEKVERARKVAEEIRKNQVAR